MIKLSGCTTAPTTEEIVKQRALERWQALIHGDFDKAYDYLSPGYRAVNPLNLYRGRFGHAVVWEQAGIKQIACTAKACEVTVSIHYRYPARNYQGESTVEERWIGEDNHWWLLPKD